MPDASDRKPETTLSASGAAIMRVATYNLLHGVDMASGRVDLGAAAAALATLEVDVVALQEVDRAQARSGGGDQVAELAAALGWHGAFGAALVGSPDTAWRVPPGDEGDGPAYGVGLVSRRPLLGVSRTRLPGGGEGRRTKAASPQRPGWDHEPRVALSARVDTADGRPLTVTTTHLSYLPWRALRQLRAAAQATGGGPAVLLGDLNLPPAVVRVALARHWVHAGGEPTYPSWRPRTQLDHVLARGLKPVEVRVGSVTSSDHLPLLATLRWAGPPA